MVDIMKKEILFLLSTKLKELREKNNLSQEELCNILNINRGTYVNWEIGRVEIPLEKLDALCLYYNVGIDYIFNFTSNLRKIKKELSFNTLATKLNKFIESNNLKIESLAIDAETTISTIWAYLHNKQKIRTIYLYRICKKTIYQQIIF